MKKVAVYVEGMTELVFVYYCIQAHYNSDWTAFHLDYVSANPSDKINIPNNFGDENAENYFLLYNCGSDESVIPTMKDRLNNHIKQGFTAVIGLQDIYGKRYFDEYRAQHHMIEWPKVNEMITDLESTVVQLDPSETMKICFSIMEIEAWMLAMPTLLYEAFPNRSFEEISQKNPETEYLHPYSILNSISDYSKNFTDVVGLCSRIRQEHILGIIESKKCSSFVRFYNYLFE